MEPITRRVFLRRTISGVGGVMLAKSFGSNISLAHQPGDMSRVVIVEHPEATDGVRVINAANVQTMMDESVKKLTGIPIVADAWRSLLPDFDEKHMVAIKVNAVAALLPTHPVVVNAIVSGLTSAGVLENNIIIYDINKSCLLNCGYKFNMGETGVRCFGTNKSGGIMGAKPVAEDGWGNDWDNPVDILGQKRALSAIVTRCDHLINVPVPKAMGPGFVVTLSLKNHFGSVDNPQSLHSIKACATLNSQADIKDKTRLIVTDALFGCSALRGGNWVVDCAPNSLIVTKDPVAADYMGTELLNKDLVKRNLPPMVVPLIEEAALMGLGTNDPERMELLKVDLGPPKEEEVEEKPEEEVGKAVNPADSYKTQWAMIKTLAE